MESEVSFPPSSHSFPPYNPDELNHEELKQVNLRLYGLEQHLSVISHHHKLPDVPILGGNEDAEFWREWRQKLLNKLYSLGNSMSEQESIRYIASRTTGLAYRTLERRLESTGPLAEPRFRTTNEVLTRLSVLFPEAVDPTAWDMPFA